MEGATWVTISLISLAYESHIFLTLLPTRIWHKCTSIWNNFFNTVYAFFRFLTSHKTNFPYLLQNFIYSHICIYIIQAPNKSRPEDIFEPKSLATSAMITKKSYGVIRFSIDSCWGERCPRHLSVPSSSSFSPPSVGLSLRITVQEKPRH